MGLTNKDMKLVLKDYSAQVDFSVVKSTVIFPSWLNTVFIFFFIYFFYVRFGVRTIADSKKGGRWKGEF